jgi:hypothetical protein
LNYASDVEPPSASLALLRLRKSELPACVVISAGPKDHQGADADGLGGSLMSPIDYFMAIFAGMCIGVAGVAYVWS